MPIVLPTLTTRIVPQSAAIRASFGIGDRVNYTTVIRLKIDGRMVNVTEMRHLLVKNIYGDKVHGIDCESRKQKRVSVSRIAVASNEQ
jgi:hypothetical protein